MALLQEWQSIAYNEKADKVQLQQFWQRYFELEKGVYEKLLENPDQVVEGTVKELADKFNLEIMAMVGFLDGINEIAPDIFYDIIFRFKIIENIGKALT